MSGTLHLHILASGSKGNAAVVEGPGGLVLVDCGISYRELGRRMALVGLDVRNLSCALVTHEHSDHTAGLSVLARHLAGPLYATPGTMAARGHLAELPFEPVAHDAVLEVCGMRVTCFPTSHDVADPMFFRFDAAGDAIGLCTDTGLLTPEAEQALRGVRILGIEANHDRHMLDVGPYPAYLKARIAGERGHLSNDQAAEALPRLVTGRTEAVVGMHLSQKNNTPLLALQALAGAVGARCPEGGAQARTTDGRLVVRVASQDVPMSIP